jgi:hypothetical protein
LVSLNHTDANYPKKVYTRELMKIGCNKNEKERNQIEYKQILVAD